MNGTEIDNVIEKLAGTSVNEGKEVSFAMRGLKLDTEEDAQEIVNAIKSCSGMTSLCLEGNTLGINAAKAIAKALEGQPKFQRALWKDMFTRRTENEIPNALQFLSSGVMLSGASLVELDLSDNAFGPRGLRGIVPLLKSPSCYTLKKLRLNNNGLGISGGTMLATALSECLANSCKDEHPLNLKVFICGRNRLENDGAFALSKFLRDIGTLEMIAMPQNGIYHEGIKALSEAFAANPGLKTLNLEDNSLTEKGAKCIAKILPDLKDLEVFNFGDCLIRTQGAVAIAETLRYSCPKIKEINLGYNEINKDGGLAIAEVMEKKDALEKLNLNGNQFGDEGCQIIEGTMEDLGKIDQLDSLSEDETGEDDADYDEEDEDYDEGDEDEDNESVKSQEEEVINSFKSPMLKPTLEDFCLGPTSQNLLALGESRRDILSALPEDPTLEDHIRLFLKVCSVVVPDDQETKLAASECADIILSTVFKKCENPGCLKDFNNLLIVYLGLIKHEDKKFKAAVDLRGPLLVLEHAVKQTYFHRETRDMLQLFLSRPLIAVEACGKIKHSLMQTLFQF